MSTCLWKKPFRVIEFGENDVYSCSLCTFRQKVTEVLLFPLKSWTCHVKEIAVKFYALSKRENGEGVNQVKENEWLSDLSIFPSWSVGHRRSHPPRSFENVLRLHRTSPLSLFFSLSNFFPVCAIQALSSSLVSLTFRSLALCFSLQVFALLHWPHFIQLPVHKVAAAWHFGTIELWQL